MCKIDMLNRNDFGCIVSCPCCEDIHLGIGSLIYIFNTEEFECFHSSVNRLYEKHYADMLLTGEKLFLKTHNKKMILAFNPNELKLLWELLSESVLILEIKNVLKIPL